MGSHRVITFRRMQKRVLPTDAFVQRERCPTERRRAFPEPATQFRPGKSLTYILKNQCALVPEGACVSGRASTKVGVAETESFSDAFCLILVALLSGGQVDRRAEVARMSGGLPERLRVSCVPLCWRCGGHSAP